MNPIKTIKNIRYIFQFLKDKEVPLFKKAIMLFGIAYFIFPIDVLPDFPVLGVGYLDDLAVMISILNYLTEYMKKYQTKESSENTDKYIKDIDYKIKDD